MTDTGYVNPNETHIERMDRINFEASQEEKRLKIQAERDIKVAKEHSKSERKEMWMVIAGCASVTSIILGLIYVWGVIPDPPKTPEDFRTSEAGREAACVENGGGWVPKDLLYGPPDQGLCVYPGKRPTIEGVPGE